MTIEENIVQILTQCRDEIRANISNKGINASGRTSAAFKVGKSDGGIMLYLDRSGRTAPLDTLEIGRPGGNVPKGFYYIIKQWTRDKGMSFESETARQRFSYFTARKIAQVGTARHKQHEDVYSTAVQKARRGIVESVNFFVASMIKQATTHF